MVYVEPEKFTKVMISRVARTHERPTMTPVQNSASSVVLMLLLNGMNPVLGEEASSADRANSIQAIATLESPKSSAAEKLSAIRLLGRIGVNRSSKDHPQILMALAHATHSDDRDVRLDAWHAMTDIGYIDDRAELGDIYKQRVFERDVKPFLEYGIDRMPAETFVRLESADSQRRQEAWKSFSRSFVASKRLQNADAKRSLRAFGAYLERMDRIEPTLKAYTLKIMAELGPGDTTVPVLIRAIRSDDTVFRSTARRLCPSDNELSKHPGIALALSNALVDEDADVSAGAAELLPKDPDDSVKAIISSSIAGAAARNNFKALDLLKTYRIGQITFAKTIAELMTDLMVIDLDRHRLLKAAQLTRLNEVLDDVEPLRNNIVTMLVIDDQPIAVTAARLLTAPKSRELALDEIVNTIRKGKTVDAEVIKAFAPDPVLLGRKLLPALQSSVLEVRAAAVMALAGTGIKEDAVRDLVKPMLRSANRDIRLAAGQAINTDEAIGRARVPDLIADARSNSLSTRSLAVRQLDELGIEPRPLTAALIAATQSGDFAARQGLLDALESANASSADWLNVLTQTATDKNADATARAYARAALHAVEKGKPPQKTAPYIPMRAECSS